MNVCALMDPKSITSGLSNEILMLLLASLFNEAFHELAACAYGARRPDAPQLAVRPVSAERSRVLIPRRRGRRARPARRPVPGARPAGG